MATKKKKTTRAVKPPRAPRVQVESRQGKPVFRAGTWIAVVVFALVIGAAIFINRQAEEEANATETPAAEESFVYDEERVVSAIEVTDAEGNASRIERNEDKVWVLSKPEKAEADPGTAEAAATQVGTLRIIAPIENADDLSIFGLDEPAYTIAVEFEDGGKSMLEVGDKTPTENGFYVNVDGEKVLVVAVSGIDTLENLLASPPYLNTPTPTPTSTPLPTGTPVPTTETITTPEATPTP
ncbi:MAG: DUF4340 domain-containing protein [Anaerolineales bacterium]|nr:DUF4340 domain-containing protein [Anaerolineales bacterium]